MSKRRKKQQQQLAAIKKEAEDRYHMRNLCEWILGHDPGQTFVYFEGFPMFRCCKISNPFQFVSALALSVQKVRNPSRQLEASSSFALLPLDAQYDDAQMTVEVLRNKYLEKENAKLWSGSRFIHRFTIDWVRTARSMYFPDCPNRHQVEYAMRRWILPDLVTLCLAYVYDDWPGLDRLLCDCVAGDIQPCLELVKGRYM
jgi:hypothetical protein